MKKRLTSVLCILFILLQSFGVYASDLPGRINKVDTVIDGGKIYFDVDAELEEDGRLIAALYDGNGNLIEKRLRDTRLGKSLSFDANEDAVSHKIMLWDKENKLKPIASSKGDVMYKASVYNAEEEYNKNARLVYDFGIINTIEEFDKERQMTKAEFACIICRMLNVADVANAFSKDSIYTDVEVSHWAAGYINLLGDSGIIDVSEEGIFSPNEPISFDHAVAALIRVLGYEAAKEELGGYTKIAEDLMITRGVSKEEFKAKDVVNLVANSLNVPMLVPYSYSPETSEDYFASEENTLLTDMGIYKVSGVVKYIGYGKMKLVCKENSEELGIDIDDEVSFKTDDVSLTDYIHELADVYVKKSGLRKYEVVSVVRNKKCKSLTLVSDDIISHTQNAVEYNSGEETKSIDIDIEYSSLNFNTYADLDDIISTEDTAIEFIDNTGDGIYDAVCGTKYHYYTVDKVDTDRKIITADRRMISLNYEESAAIILCDDKGNKLTLEDFDVNDPVAMVSDSRGSNPQLYYDYIKIIKLTKSAFKATVESVFTENRTEYAVIDGKTYVNTSWEILEPGETYMLRLGFTGKIAFAEVYDGGVSQSGGMYLGNSMQSILSDSSVQYEENTRYLSSLGIMKEFPSSETEISRADFANSLCNAMNLETEAYKDKNIFNDITSSHYASGAINLLAEKGIMGAYSENSFCPDTNMRYAHAIYSLVKALGYSPMARVKGKSALGYVRCAKQLGILNNIQNEYYLDAKMLVGIIKNILPICHMEEITDGEYAVMDGMEYKTYLSERDIYTATGIITDITEDSVTFEAYEDSEDNEFEYGGQYVFDINEYSALDLLYMCADVCVKKTGADKYQLMYITPNNMGSVVITESYAIESIYERDLIYYTDPGNSYETKKIKYNIDTNSIVYNMGTGKINIEDIPEIKDARVVFLENTGDNIYDMAVVTTYKYGFVDSVDEKAHKITVDGTDIELRAENTNILADIDSKKISITDFKKGDFVAIVSDGLLPENYDKFLMIQNLSDNKITGEVYSRYVSNGREHVVINKTEYRINTELDVGDRGHFYIGKTGIIEQYIPDFSTEGTAYILDVISSSDRWHIEVLDDNYGITQFDVSDIAHLEFDSYLASNSDAFGLEDSNGNYLFENASDAEKINNARLISYKLNSNGEISQLAKLETKGTVQLESELYDASTKTIAETVLDGNTKVFNVSDSYASDISCLRKGVNYSGCILKDVNNTSVVIITEFEAVNTEKGDLLNAETAFAVVKSVIRSNPYSVVVDYFCNEADGSVIIDSASLMQGDINWRNIGVGDVFAFISDEDGYATDYAVIATMDDDGLTLSEVGIDAVSDSETEFVHGYIEYVGLNFLEITPDGNGRTEEIYSKYANRYTFDDSIRGLTIVLSGGFMEHPDMNFYDEDIGYTSKIFARVVDGEATDIYGYYHLLANK